MSATLRIAIPVAYVALNWSGEPEVGAADALELGREAERVVTATPAVTTNTEATWTIVYLTEEFSRDIDEDPGTLAVFQ